MSWPTAGSAADLAQALARDIASRADQADREGRLPVQDVQALRESGYLTLSAPPEYGGQGLSLRDCALAQIELAQGSASTALVAAMTLHIFGHAAEARPWPEPVFESFCRAVVDEGALFNLMASEPVLGSPSRGGAFATTAAPSPDGSGWIVSGHKTWSTGGKHLTHMLVRLSLENEAGLMLVRQGTPGIEWEETWCDSLSLRASDSHDVRFQDVHVPADHLIERSGLEAGRAAPNAWFPVMVASVYLGTAIAARDAVIRYTLERIPTALGKPIATLPKIQRQIGEIDIALRAALSFFLEVAGAWRGGEAADRQFPDVAAAKHLAVETANTVTHQALCIAGGASLTRDLPLERYFRDVRAGLMQPPAGDAALEIAGRAAVERLDAASRS